MVSGASARRVVAGWALSVVLLAPGSARGQELTGEVLIEGRLFTQSALRDSLSSENLSIAFEPELYLEWGNGRQALTLVPFLRLDQHDRERTHWDIRELTWEYIEQQWELRAGVRKVFWGVAESNHLVDIINQTDLVENLDGEDKLGQPMINLALIQSWGTVDLFALVGFRERRYFGDDGRPGVPFPLDTDDPIFESSKEHGHIDWAVRWAHAIGAWDIGVSHFHGTSRDPRFVSRDPEGDVVFVPVYDLIDQTGLDLQLTQGGWLWKLELINRVGQGPRFAASTAGFEYTFANMGSAGLDLGVLAEYSFDERDEAALTPLEDDIFVGARLALNDVQSTEILAGTAIDRESGASFIIVEASRRFGDNWTLDLEVRSFVGVPPEDLFLSGIRNDDYIQASWAFHF